MLKFLKKHADVDIYSPVKGKCIDISEVEDEGFSSKVMGDGIAVIPEENLIKAPADGKLTMLFETGHAFGISADNGADILVHIGIDTVNLNGLGFTSLKKTGDKVKRGEPVIRIELEKLEKEYDMSTMVIVTNGKKFQKPALYEEVDENTPVLEGIE